MSLLKNKEGRSKDTTLNREAWLTELARLVEPLFKGYSLAPYRVTCGWPCRNGTGKRKRTLGECHPRASSPGGYHEIFISPLLGRDGQDEVAGVLCHEMAHIAAGTKAAHGKDFVKVCRHVGLTKGAPTVALPGEALEERLADLMDNMGEYYPHVGMQLPSGRAATRKSSSEKVFCACGQEVSVRRSFLEAGGVLVCGCGLEMVAY